VDPGAIATRRRVTVVEDDNAEFSVPRLVIRAPGGPGLTGTVTWELSYGGLPIAAGSLGPAQEVSFAEVVSIQPSMDSAGLTITARHGDGEDCAIEATCVRPMRPPTRAEATARARWPGARNQRETPQFRRALLAGTRDITLPASPGADTDPRSRRVCVYQPIPVLLEFRRRLVRGEPWAAQRQAAPDRPG
jgi:hypothetical protein